jgi:hypothetical protein
LIKGQVLSALLSYSSENKIKGYHMQMTKMEHKGFFAKIMEAPRLTGSMTHGLPPGTPLPVYYADAFNNYPLGWMKGPGVFIVPVKPNKGLWFDWRDNDANNTAVIPTVKGCNPITGLQTTGFFMERYDNKCPIHGCDFQAVRFCPECGYKWESRNYVSNNPLWWDGFTSGGDVRQFFFTEDMMRDIATHMIGKDNTVPAFGFAFYRPKEPRSPTSTSTRLNLIYQEPESYVNYITLPTYSHSLNYTLSNSIEKKSKGFLRGIGELRCRSAIKDSVSPVADTQANSVCNSEQQTLYMVSPDTGRSLDCLCGENVMETYKERSTYTPEKEVAVGAGAKIRQKLPEDSYPLDSWKDKPDSVMTIYFVFQEEFERLAAGGMKDFKDCKDGMLAGLPVG